MIINLTPSRPLPQILSQREKYVEFLLRLADLGCRIGHAPLRGRRPQRAPDGAGRTQHQYVTDREEGEGEGLRSGTEVTAAFGTAGP